MRIHLALKSMGDSLESGDGHRILCGAALTAIVIPRVTPGSTASKYIKQLKRHNSVINKILYISAGYLARPSDHEPQLLGQVDTQTHSQPSLLQGRASLQDDTYCEYLNSVYLSCTEFVIIQSSKYVNRMTCMSMVRLIMG